MRWLPCLIISALVASGVTVRPAMAEYRAVWEAYAISVCPGALKLEEIFAQDPDAVNDVTYSSEYIDSIKFSSVSFSHMGSCVYSPWEFDLTDNLTDDSAAYGWVAKLVDHLNQRCIHPEKLGNCSSGAKSLYNYIRDYPYREKITAAAAARELREEKARREARKKSVPRVLD